MIINLSIFIIAVSSILIVKAMYVQTKYMKEMLILQNSFHSMHYHETELTKQYLKCKIKEAENGNSK